MALAMAMFETILAHILGSTALSNILFVRLAWENAQILWRLWKSNDCIISSRLVGIDVSSVVADYTHFAFIGLADGFVQATLVESLVGAVLLLFRHFRFYAGEY